MKLFIHICIPNMSNPEKVRTWAHQHSLPRVSNSIALSIFAGKGPKVQAWYVPSQIGKFALALRGPTEACTVFARQADPTESETLFRKLLEGIKRPGVDVAVIDERRTPTQAGQEHALSYTVRPTEGRTGYIFILVTVERPGAGFQAKFEVSRAIFPPGDEKKGHRPSPH